jgi:hypothetical protein
MVTVPQVLKELDSLCKDSSLTPEALKAVATRLFRHSQHLLDEFLMLGKARRNRKKIYYCKKHVAIPGCLSRILIFIHLRSRISDHGSRIRQQHQKRRGKKFVCYHFNFFFVATNIIKL